MPNLATHKEGVASLQPSLLTRVSRFVEARMGLHFPEERLKDLARGIRSAAKEFGFDTMESFIEWLLSSSLSRSQIETLASHLTVGETYFFRDARIFEILEAQLFPEIINSRRDKEQNLRIWSAGCSTGEEPYSIAIVLSRFFPGLANRNSTILATDIAPSSLKKAREGIYGEWAFRDTPHWVREKYFIRQQRNFQIDPAIKRLVTFSLLNLVEDPYPAIINNTTAMDIIFCRNVLMYFTRERAAEVIHNLSRCLVDGGWLVISPVEAPGPDLTLLLYPVHFPGAILYRKGTKPEAEATLPLAPPRPQPLKRKTAVAGKTRYPARVRHQEKVSSPRKHPLTNTGPGADQVRQLADQGRLTDALVVCEEAILADKLNPALRYLQATILQAMGRKDECAASLQRAIYIDQDFLIAHFVLGHLLQGQGKSREAAKHFDKASALLKSYGSEDVVPEGEGLSAGRLNELINMMRGARERR